VAALVHVKIQVGLETLALVVAAAVLVALVKQALELHPPQQLVALVDQDAHLPLQGLLLLVLVAVVLVAVALVLLAVQVVLAAVAKVLMTALAITLLVPLILAVVAVALT
jgi:hypothetical protein